MSAGKSGSASWLKKYLMALATVGTSSSPRNTWQQHTGGVSAKGAGCWARHGCEASSTFPYTHRLALFHGVEVQFLIAGMLSRHAVEALYKGGGDVSHMGGAQWRRRAPERGWRQHMGTKSYKHTCSVTPLASTWLISFCKKATLCGVSMPLYTTMRQRG